MDPLIIQKLQTVHIYRQLRLLHWYSFFELVLFSNKTMLCSIETFCIQESKSNTWILEVLTIVFILFRSQVAGSILHYTLWTRSNSHRIQMTNRIIFHGTQFWKRWIYEGNSSIMQYFFSWPCVHSTILMRCVLEFIVTIAIQHILEIWFNTCFYMRPHLIIYRVCFQRPSLQTSHIRST